MSPALVDHGSPTNCRNGQIFSSYSFDFHVSNYNSQSNHSAVMNPLNLGDMSSGFSNSSQTNTNSSFNPPPVHRSSGVSRPRLVKVRKQANSQNLKSRENTESAACPGFNPFHATPGNLNLTGSSTGASDSNASSGQTGSEAFVFGASKSDSVGNLNSRRCNSNEEIGKGILEEIRNLKIGSLNEFRSEHRKNPSFNETVSSKLSEDMRKLNMEGSQDCYRKEETRDANFRSTINKESKLLFTSGSIVGNSAQSSMEYELPNELNSKLNIKGTEEVDGSNVMYSLDAARNPIFNVSTNCNDSLRGSTEDVLSDGLRELNIKNNVNGCDIAKSKNNAEVNDKDTFISKTSKVTGNYLAGDEEGILSDEISRKLNISNTIGDFSGKASKRFSSPPVLMKNMPTGNASKLPPIGKPVHMEFGVQGAVHVKDSISRQGSLDHSIDGIKPGAAATSTPLFSNSEMPFQAGESVHGLSSTSTPEKAFEFSFSSRSETTGRPSMEFKTPGSKGNVVSGFNKKIEFSGKKESFKDTKLNRKEKLKQPTSVHISLGKDFVSREKIDHEALESYSPMDVSPYPNSVGYTQHSGSDGSFGHNNYPKSAVSHDLSDEDLIDATLGMSIKEGELKYKGSKEGASVYSSGGGAGPENLPHTETESFKSAAEEIEVVNSTETEDSSTAKSQKQEDDGRVLYGFLSNPEASGSNFTFASSTPAVLGQPSAPKRLSKKKVLVKPGLDSSSTTSSSRVPYGSSSVQFSSFTGASSLLPPNLTSIVDLSTSAGKAGNDLEVETEPEIKHVADISSVEIVAAQEACENWRLRGNEAYTNKDMSKAEECYTQGINCMSNELSKSSIKALMLCYSNRAATRMSLGRIRDALGDCMMAAEIDPNFLKVQVRAANCYLALGEVEDASRYFRKCLQYESDIPADRKVEGEASEGLQKAQKVSTCVRQFTELLQSSTCNDIESALEVITEALSISSYSEKFLEMKAETLFKIRRYEEVIKLCEETFDSGMKNALSSSNDMKIENRGDSKTPDDSKLRLWRCYLILKSYFYLGKLEDAIASLERNGGKTLESSLPLVAIVRELLRHKAAGNEAFQSGRHAEAVEHYTAALSYNVESRPFAAVCFCNRASAHKALGQITDAIADCSLAIALDGNYFKAISRRASLFEMIRDYGQSANDLQRLIVLLTKLVEERTNQSAASDRSINCNNELRRANLRLFEIEEEARKGAPLDKYLILGVEPSVSASEIRKAYRRAALRHHPDKAGQSLARNDNGEDKLWKEIGEEVHRDADRLFKMIGEAYAVLSDPTKRARYDLEEETRNVQKRRDGSNAQRGYAEAQNFQFENSGSRQHWRSYANSPARGFETSRSSRYSY